MDNFENDLILVGDMFEEIFQKYSFMESKKNLYKAFKDLTLIEINTILVIGRDEMKSMSSIAKLLGVSLGTPTVTMDRLIKKKYVERIRDVGDRRQVFIKLSQKGTDAYDSILELKNRTTGKIFGILTAEERIVLVRILDKINKKLDTVVENNPRGDEK